MDGMEHSEISEIKPLTPGTPGLRSLAKFILQAIPHVGLWNPWEGQWARRHSLAARMGTYANKHAFAGKPWTFLITWKVRNQSYQTILYTRALSITFLSVLVLTQTCPVFNDIYEMSVASQRWVLTFYWPHWFIWVDQLENFENLENLENLEEILKKSWKSGRHKQNKSECASWRCCSSTDSTVAPTN